MAGQVQSPHQITEEAFVIPVHWQTPGAEMGTHLNSMVLSGSEPILFDTGPAALGPAWMESVASVVDPGEVRWVVISHDDADHVGNLGRVLEQCPNATVVANWFICERLAADLSIDPRQLRWVDAGERLELADRTLHFARPPLYDNPTTRVTYDSASRVLWAADLFATPVAQPTLDAAEMDPTMLEEGFRMFQQWASPWWELIDDDRFQREVESLAAWDVGAIASTHGPAFSDGMVDRAFDLLARVPDEPAPPWPGQPVLDEIVASLPDTPVS